MDFEISDKMNAILEMMNEFMEKEVIPLEPEYLNRSFVDMLPELEEKRRLVRQMELWAPQHPRDYGGMGLDIIEFGLVSEVLGRSPLGHFVFGAQAPDAGNIEILHLHGTEEQKEIYLQAPGGRRNPELFFHDRGGTGRLQSGAAGHHRSQGR